ncbi:MAG: hypothetical protein RR232_02710 [Clostridia bacterium]
MSYIKEKVAYLRGLAEGMEIGGDAQGKLLNAMIAAMDEMADAIDENEVAVMELDECVDDIYDELDDLDDYLSDDDDDYDDDFVEVECPHCGETVYYDQNMLEGKDDLICPNCNESVVPGIKEE